MSELEMLEQMIGNTYYYDGKKLTVQDATVKGNIGTLKTTAGEVQLNISEINEELREFKLIKENALMKNSQVIDVMFDENSSYNRASKILLDTIEKVQASSDYIPQAQAINETMKNVIELEKARTGFLSLFKG